MDIPYREVLPSYLYPYSGANALGHLYPLITRTGCLLSTFKDNAKLSKDVKYDIIVGRGVSVPHPKPAPLHGNPPSYGTLIPQQYGMFYRHIIPL